MTHSECSTARRLTLMVLLILLCGGLSTSRAETLEQELGRSEMRISSGIYPLIAGVTVTDARLVERLQRRGYRRVRHRPRRPGEYFYGHEVFWIYRRAHRWAGQRRRARLFGLELRREDGLILRGRRDDDASFPLEREDVLWLEPVTLSESLTGDRAPRTPIELERLPEHVWRAVLAAEDARFFEHPGVDARALARAALSNLESGAITQGGSTITQQLIKNRDLTPKRSMGRKLSEAARALLLETQFDKREILQAYLNQVYLGHIAGLAVHGIGTASRAYFSKPAHELSLDEAALLAGMIQGPNRLHPVRHPQRARRRRDWVLDRLERLAWIDPGLAEAARSRSVSTHLTAPPRPPASWFLSWVADEVEQAAAQRLKRSRGVRVETTLDPWLQRHAESVVVGHLARLRRDHPRLRDRELSAALVALDTRSGEVLAYVGGDPTGGSDGFDRARARRQPGSTVKPLVLLASLNRCEPYGHVTPATRVADSPITIPLPQGAWTPENWDHRFRGPVTVRRALADSINVPFVRMARTCGLEAAADRLRRAGLTLADEPPPSFVLGAVETSPLELAGAFTLFGNRGRRAAPLAVRRVERPGGRVIERGRVRRRRVTDPGTAYLVRDLMHEAVQSGTAWRARLVGVAVSAKTGTSDGRRDAWLAGHAGSLVAVVWLGLDDGGSLGLSGGAAAAPLWRDFMAAAVPTRAPHRVARPESIVERSIDPTTGLRVRAGKSGSRQELFRRNREPRRDRWWRYDTAAPVLE